MAHNLGRAIGRLAGAGLDTTTIAALRRKVFTVPGRLVRSARSLNLKLAAFWPWARSIDAAIQKIQAILLRC